MRIYPRTFGEVLRAATTGFFRIWRPLVWPVLLLSAVAGVATVVSFTAVGANELLELLINDPDALAAMTDEEFFELLVPFYAGVGIAVVIQVLLASFLYIATAKAVAVDLAGGEVEGAAVARDTIRKLGTGIWAAIVFGIVVLAMLVLGTLFQEVPLVLPIIIVSTVWLVVSLLFCWSVLGFEDQSAIEALDRSRRLVSGRWLQTAGYVLIVGLLGTLAVQLIQVIALPLTAAGLGGTAVVVGALFGILAQGIIVGAIGVAYAYWYLDLRARKEVLIIEDLA